MHNTNKQNIFLDTNIILSAINIHSTSNLLKFITDDYNFYYSNIVKREIDKKISESKKSKGDKIHMRLAVKKFIGDIQLLTAKENPLKQSSSQSNDDFIIEIAQQSNCKSICTYNHKDFKYSDFQLSLPTNLLRKSSLDSYKRLNLIFNLQKDISNEWSILLSFDFKGLTSDLIILEDTTENKILLKQNGIIELIKKNTIIKKSNTIVKNNTPIKLLITKNKNNIQIYNLEVSFKQLIDSKTTFNTILPSSILILNEKNNGKFYGHIQEISMYPKCIAKHIDFKKIVYYNTLEYRWGSLTI